MIASTLTKFKSLILVASPHFRRPSSSSRNAPSWCRPCGATCRRGRRGTWSCECKADLRRARTDKPAVGYDGGTKNRYSPSRQPEKRSSYVAAVHHHLPKLAQ